MPKPCISRSASAELPYSPSAADVALVLGHWLVAAAENSEDPARFLDELTFMAEVAIRVRGARRSLSSKPRVEGDAASSLCGNLAVLLLSGDLVLPRVRRQ